MAKSNVLENEWMLHLFNNADIPNVGDAAGLQNSAVAGSLYIALHTGDPGEAGAQNASEVSYTGYARVAVARSGAGWTVTGGQVVNAAQIAFGQRSDVGSTVATHFSVGKESSGATDILYKGPLGTVVQGPFTADAATDVFTCPGHSLANDERVAFFSAFGSSLPSGVTEGTLYWVIGVSGDTFQISTTQGGGAVNITTNGDGVAYEARTLTITQFVTPTFAAGQLVIEEF